jgi:hypothetical protein
LFTGLFFCEKLGYNPFQIPSRLYKNRNSPDEPEFVQSPGIDARRPAACSAAENQ